jgi:hypothetical protein
VFFLKTLDKPDLCRVTDIKYSAKSRALGEEAVSGCDNVCALMKPRKKK